MPSFLPLFFGPLSVLFRAGFVVVVLFLFTVARVIPVVIVAHDEAAHIVAAFAFGLGFGLFGSGSGDVISGNVVITVIS